MRSYICIFIIFNQRLFVNSKRRIKHINIKYNTSVYHMFIAINI